MSKARAKEDEQGWKIYFEGGLIKKDEDMRL